MSYDFTKLRFDITRVPDGVFLIDHFEELSEYKEFSDKEEDLTLRIVILATDILSPFVQTIRDDYEKRITKIFEYLKIKNENLFENIITGAYIKYNAMVNRYFIMSDNLAYVMWSDKFKNFHFIGLALREPPNMNDLAKEMDKRAKLGVQQQAIYKELIELESQIFPDTFTRKIAKEQVAKILQIPEKMAQEKGVI